MSKQAVQALIAAASADSEIAEILKKDTSVTHHVINSILSLSAAELAEVRGMLNNRDLSRSVVEKADSRNNPGPAVTG